MGIPSSDEIIDLAQQLFATYGYWFVFFGAIVEGLLFLTIYFPGSTVIALAAVFARTGQLSLPLVILIGTAGLQIGLTIDYFLGKYGWYHLLVKLGMQGALDRAKERVERYGVYAMLTGYLIPLTAVLIATSAGILRVPLPRFLLASTTAVFVWVTIVSVAAYLVGEEVVRTLGRYFWYVFFIVVGVWWLWTKLIEGRKTTEKPESK